MSTEPAFPVQAAFLSRIIRFALTYFWFIYTGLLSVVVCCAFASYLSVGWLRYQAIGLALTFTAIAWVFIFIVALLRESKD